MDTYESFKKQIYDITKIDLNAYKERQMKRRIDSLIQKRGAKGYDEYVRMISADKELFEEFVSFLTINVSEFYRNPEQWVLLEKDVIPALLKKSPNLKVWSAACSTGDEPYSLVMLLSKFMPLSRIHIIATDIDKQILEKAKLGLYSDKSIKDVPKEFVDKYFTKIGNSYKINDEIKKCVEFKKHDLLKDEYPKDCDLIVCRNVLIYFTEEAKFDIYKKFYAALKPESILFIGATEQILRSNEIGYKSIKPFFYQK